MNHNMNHNMNQILLKLCQHSVSVAHGSWYPYPSTCLAKECDMSLYKTRKELKMLKEQGLVASEQYCEVGEDRNILISGYTITDKAKDTEEYRTAWESERALYKEVYDFDIGDAKNENWR